MGIKGDDVTGHLWNVIKVDDILNPLKKSYLIWFLRYRHSYHLQGRPQNPLNDKAIMMSQAHLIFKCYVFLYILVPFFQRPFCHLESYGISEMHRLIAAILNP